jgi:hypothetical protein
MVLCTEKRVLRANLTIYTSAAYVVTFAWLCSYGLSREPLITYHANDFVLAL